MNTLYNVSLLAVTIIVIFQTVVIFYLARYIGEFMSKIESINGIKVGSLQEGQTVPNFRELDSQGRKVVSKDFFNKRSILLFVNTNCATCKEVIPEIDRIINTYKIQVLVINTDENHDDVIIRKNLGDRVSYMRSNKITQLYSITKVPYALIIEENEVKAAGELKNKGSLWNLLINENRLVS
ncbi:redoxin domain-containing protein [Bacillus sp. P14.5]|uniref:TlpA family protein disulfide reductase n=1 Tax=Bacillus sp. P14.5 TaxID=1983400 RepID=UPI000DE8E7A6|nr:redoxin domain-containing protein [Bacillus sp. P14.5]